MMTLIVHLEGNTRAFFGAFDTTTTTHNLGDLKTFSTDKNKRPEVEREIMLFPLSIVFAKKTSSIIQRVNRALQW